MLTTNPTSLLLDAADTPPKLDAFALLVPEWAGEKLVGDFSQHPDGRPPAGLHQTAAGQMVLVGHVYEMEPALGQILPSETLPGLLVRSLRLRAPTILAPFVHFIEGVAKDGVTRVFWNGADPQDLTTWPAGTWSCTAFLDRTAIFTFTVTILAEAVADPLSDEREVVDVPAVQYQAGWIHAGAGTDHSVWQDAHGKVWARLRRCLDGTIGWQVTPENAGYAPDVPKAKEEVEAVLARIFTEPHVLGPWERRTPDSWGRKAATVLGDGTDAFTVTWNGISASFKGYTPAGQHLWQVAKTPSQAFDLADSLAFRAGWSGKFRCIPLPADIVNPPEEKKP